MFMSTSERLAITVSFSVSRSPALSLLTTAGMERGESGLALVSRLSRGKQLFVYSPQTLRLQLLYEIDGSRG